MRFFTSGIFHQTIPSRFLIQALKYFRILLRNRREIKEYLCSRDMRHSGGPWHRSMGPWSSAMPHSANFFVQNLYEDDYVWSHAMLHSTEPWPSAIPHSAGQNCIALDKFNLSNFGPAL
jgi:hypothetical protein